MSGGGGPSTKTDAIVIGVVQELDDPQKLGRVRVRFPHLADQISQWARIATLMAGADRGSLFRPEPEDEVLVAFLHGDPAQPYVIGALWNESDTPPENGGAAENHLRTLKTRSGHVLRFDDTPGEEKIEVISSDEKQRITIDVGGQKVSVEADQGDVLVKTGTGNVEVDSGGAVTVKAQQSVKIEAPQINVEASGTLTLKGAMVKIN
ncbi:MAG TPA: phage baseplate assembly protein V [Longimicrobium sp.]|nr:phage baseplate assembly protein V [Longimicrobium sp.]